MKKLFSIFAAALFATSLFANVVTLDPSTQDAVDGGQSGVAISLSIEGVDISYTGGLGINSSGEGDFRVFGGQSLTLSASENITKVVITGKANKANFTASVDNGEITTGASYSAVTEKKDLTDPLIVIEDIDNTSVTLSVTKQLRAYLIEVTLEDGALADGYYLVRGDGSLVAFEENATVPGEFVIWDINLEFGEQLSGLLVKGEMQVPLPDATTKYTVNEDFAGRSNIYFRPAGNTDWEWNYLYIQHIFEDGYYLVGDFNEWKPNDDYRMRLNEGADVEEYVFWMWLDKTENGEVKVIKIEDNVQTWIPAEGGNLVIEARGDLDIYFRPEGNSDWDLFYIYAAEHVYVDEFYLIGERTDWQLEEDSKFFENPENPGEYMFECFLAEGEEINIAIANAGEIVGWAPGDTKDDVVTIDADHAGAVVIYLNLEGNEYWAENYPAGLGFIWIEVLPDWITPSGAKERALAGNTEQFEIRGYVTRIAETWKADYGNVSFWLADEMGGEEQFEAFRITCAEDEVPGVNDYVSVIASLTTFTKEGVTIAESDNKKEQSFSILKKYEPEPEKPADGFYLVMTVEGEEIFDEDAKFFQNYACVETVEYMLTMWIEPEVEYRLKVVKIEDGEIVARYPEGDDYMIADKSGNVSIYFREDGNAEWDLTYIFIANAPEYYYLVGNFTDWELSDNYQFTYNMEADEEEWVVRAELAEGDEFKVVGLLGDEWIWYPAEGGNMIPETVGDVDVYFRPQGKIDWGNFYAYVAEHVEIDYLSCEEVAVLAEGIAEPTSENKTTTNGDEVKVRGYVTWASDVKSNSPARKAQIQSVWLADDPNATSGTVQIYNAEIVAQLQKGDFVEAEGTLCKFWKGEGNVILEITEGTLKKIEVPGVEIDIVATGCILSDGTGDADPWWQIIHYGEDYNVYICFNSAVVDGTYDVNDLDRDYSGIYDAAAEKDIAIVSADLTATTTSGEIPSIHVVGTLVGDDGNTYNVDLTFTTPVPEATVTITMNNAILADQIEEYGEFYFLGEAALDENQYLLQITLYSDVIAGSYIADDMNWNYSGFLIDGAPVDIYSAEFEVIDFGDGSYSIFAALICYNNVGYEITLNVPAEITGVNNTEVLNKVMKAIQNGQLIIKTNGVEFNANGARVK